MSNEQAQSSLLVQTAAVALALTAGTMLVAAIVRLALAAPARHLLAFPFGAQHASLQLAARIFTNNLRGLAAFVGVAMIAWAPSASGRAATAADRLWRAFGEIMLTAGIAYNVVLIGAAFGAYGSRMLLAALPQGPFELAAYALALAGYLHQRREHPAVRSALLAGALSVALLALAAVLEAYITV